MNLCAKLRQNRLKKWEKKDFAPPSGGYTNQITMSDDLSVLEEYM